MRLMLQLSVVEPASVVAAGAVAAGAAVAPSVTGAAVTVETLVPGVVGEAAIVVVAVSLIGTDRMTAWLLQLLLLRERQQSVTMITHFVQPARHWQTMDWYWYSYAAPFPALRQLVPS